MPRGNQATERVEISAPNMKIAVIKIQGSDPLVMNKFSEKAKQEMIDKQKGGSTSGSKKKREAKDFDLLYRLACHVAPEGWYGIPAAAFRNAMISSCRLVGYVMTRAKLSIFIIPDGFDKDDKTPLVKITHGEPHRYDAAVRLETGVCDIRSRPMWDPGWEATVQIRFDADQLTLKDVYNLLYRAGLQIGICEGRNDSKKSNGQGWGSFVLVSEVPEDEKVTESEPTAEKITRKARKNGHDTEKALLATSAVN